MTDDEIKTPAEVAQDIHDELGNWTLGQLDDAGLRDAIWDSYGPFSRMPEDEQAAFWEAVDKELYG